ncbi:MAG TPA: ankyrin repeat domain-containing protein [Bryobacteraceae bacterium]|nr:ankyrin repeat domain-containing protein [Bryobacteraceae bacterium]
MRLLAILLLAFPFAAHAWDANDDLLSASRAGDLTAVKAALDKGAGVEAKTPYGQTPLYLAAMNGHEEVVRFLLDKGASTDIKDTFYKASILDFVIQRKHWGIAKLLAAKTTKPDETLSDVADSGRAELVQAVLDAGKPSQKALDEAYAGALEKKQAEVAALLKKAGAQEPPPPVTVDAAVLQSYVGSFRSDQLPVEVKISIKEGVLYLQASGQQELATKTLSATRFAFVPARLEIEFDSADSFTLKQGGASFKFKKTVSK